MKLFRHFRSQTRLQQRGQHLGHCEWYSNGESERIVGKALRKHNIRREKVVIMVKFWSATGPDLAVITQAREVVGRHGWKMADVALCVDQWQGRRAHRRDELRLAPGGRPVHNMPGAHGGGRTVSRRAVSAQRHQWSSLTGPPFRGALLFFLSLFFCLFIYLNFVFRTIP